MDYPKIQKVRLSVYDEAKLFYEKAMEESSMVRAMLLISSLFGLRRGEVVALIRAGEDQHQAAHHAHLSALQDRRGVRAV